MRFSFIVPVYSTSKYLEKCMESLLCQKGADFEIVLIDDGSTDDSGELCDTYAEKYPELIRVVHKQNEGLLLTRRRGFKEAKGDWLICIDSDDYANARLLETVVEAIEKFRPDMVMYNFEYVNDEGVTTQSRLDLQNESVYEGETKQAVYAKRLLSDDINNMWSKALKREIVDIDADYSSCGIRNMCEDAVQVLPLFTTAEKIVYLSVPLYYYRKGQNSITSKMTYDNWLASKSCFFITQDYLDKWEVSDEIRQRFYTHNSEILTNFLRWFFSQPDDQRPKSLSEVVHSISSSSGLTNCIEMYNKNYAKTPYLKFSVPRIMKYVQNENAKGLKRFFAMEKKLLLIK